MCKSKDADRSSPGPGAVASGVLPRDLTEAVESIFCTTS